MNQKFILDRFAEYAENYQDKENLRADIHKLCDVLDKELTFDIVYTCDKREITPLDHLYCIRAGKREIFCSSEKIAVGIYNTMYMRIYA